MIARALLCACYSVLLSRAAAAQAATDTTRDTTRARAQGVTTSRFTVSGDRLRALPVDDPAQALVVVPGVVLRGGDIGIDQLARLSLRGNAPGEAAVYVDGAPVRFQLFGGSTIPLAVDAVDEISVTTGLADVGLPDARGGVIAYLTRAGGERVQASFHGGTDEPFGTGSSLGYNHFAAFVNGPLPAVPGLTWAFSASAQGEGSPYRGSGIASQPAFVMNGLDTAVTWVDGGGNTVVTAVPAFARVTGLKRPMDWATLVRGHAKIDYHYGEGSTASLTVLAGGAQQRFFPGQDIGDPALYAGMHDWSRIGIVNWRQTLGRLRGGALALSANLSLGTDREVSGPLAPGSELDTRDPALGIEWGAIAFTGSDLLPFPISDQIIRNVRTNSGLRTPYLNRTDLRNSQPFRTNPFGVVTGWATQGLDADLTLISERRLDGRWTLDWSPGTTHRVSVGADFNRTDLSYYSSGLLTELNLDAYHVEPRRLGAFATDRITTGRVTAEVGFRYDRFNPRGLFPTTPGRIFTNPGWSPAAATSDTAYTASLARVFTGATTKGLLSPQARIAVAVGSGTSVRASIGQHAVPPSLGSLFAGTNSDLSFTSALGPVFGRDVRYAKSTTIEAGVHYDPGSAVVADVAVHHETALRPYEPRLLSYDDPANPGRSLTVNSLAETGEVHGTGADVSLAWQRGAVLDAVVAYSYLRTTEEGRVAVSTHALGARVGMRVPSDWKAGSFLGAVAGDLQATVLLRAASGLPYTRLRNVGSGILALEEEASLLFLSGAEPLGVSRLPWTKTVDLRLSRNVRTVGGDWTVFADFRNLFGFKNTIDAYAETGTDANDLYRVTALRDEYTRLQIEANANGALLAANTVDLRGCAGWQSPVNCVALQRVERRFGDGNGLYTQAEQDRALNTYFDSFTGAWRFHGPGRTVRVGMELRL